MLRHKNVAEHKKLMTASQPLKAAFEDNSQFVVVQKRSATIATKSKKVQMIGLLVSPEVDRHGESLASIPTHDQRRVMGGPPGAY